MGLLDDAIKEHLELKRRRGADAEEVTRLEQEALGAAAARRVRRGDRSGRGRRAAPARGRCRARARAGDGRSPRRRARARAARRGRGRRLEDEPPAEPEEPEEVVVDQPTVEYAPPAEPPAEGEDVLEETPEFLQETPEHDRLWFEQKPPRDFDLDR